MPVQSSGLRPNPTGGPGLPRGPRPREGTVAEHSRAGYRHDTAQASLRSRSVPTATRSERSSSESRRSAARAKQAAVDPPVPNIHPRPSALGMAYARGAQKMRQAAQRLQAPDLDKPLFVLELVVRTACTAFQHAWREVCAVRACSRQLKDICSEDHIWEQLFKLRWPPQATANTKVPTPEEYSGWRKAFLTRLRRVQASFLARNMPSLVQKNRRRDGFPNLKKVYDALRMSFSLSISQGSKSQNFFFNAEASIQLFESALCLRCTFSSLQLRCPLHFNLRGRSSSVGKEEILVTSTLQKPGDWNETSNEGGCKFLRSPCGRLFLAFWSDDTLAGMYVTMHYAHIFRSVLAESEAWGLLAGRPPVDDLDSCLGLHDYTVALSLRSAKLECFSNTFYKVHLFGLGSNKSGFGGVGYSMSNRSTVYNPLPPETIPQNP